MNQRIEANDHSDGLPRLTRIEPTVLYKDQDGTLRQLVRVGVATGDAAPASHRALLRLRAGGLDRSLPLGALAPGESAHDAWFPDLRQPADVCLGLEVDGRLCDERTMTWEPQRHWEVYLIHY